MKPVILTEFWPEASHAGQNLRKRNFLKFFDVIKKFPKSEMKFKFFLSFCQISVKTTGLMPGLNIN